MSLLFVDIHNLILIIDEVSLGLLPISESHTISIIRAAMWVAFHVYSDFALISEDLRWNVESQGVFIKMTLESQLNFLVLGILVIISSDLFEQRVWTSHFINAFNLESIILQ